LDEKEINPGHKDIRLVLRVIGPLLILLGVGCIFVAVLDIFGTMNRMGTPGPPKKFFLFFLGAPTFFLGLIVSKFAYLGAAARYMAQEILPVSKDGINYIAEGTQKGVSTITRSLGAGLAEGMGTVGPDGEPGIRCHKCNMTNDGDSKFCNGCSTLACPQ
jgi:hypothetical protein